MERNTRIRSSQLANVLPNDIDAINALVDTYVPSYDSATGQFSWVANAGGGGGANTALSNLASVAINTTLLPGVDDSIDLGSVTLEFKDLYIDGIAYIDTADIGELRLANIAGNTFIVGVGCTYTTIQGAMNVVVAGDTILVTEGTYSEAVTFTQDNITLKALGSKENTIITQVAATVVYFSTMSGCVLEGFAVNLTAADAATDYCISGANDDVSDYNSIINCDIIRTASTAALSHRCVSLTDGNWHFINCKIEIDSNYASTLGNEGFIFYINILSPHIIKIDHCEILGDWEHTGNNSSYGLSSLDPAIIWIRDCKFDLETETATGEIVAIYAQDANSTINIFDSYIRVNCNGAGATRALTVASISTLVNSYNNIYNSSNADNDSIWVQFWNTGTLNSYGDQIIDGTISNASGGTVNLYDTNEKGIITNSKNSGARAYRSENQLNLVSGVLTKIQLSSETYDVQNEFDSTTNYRFTAKKAGYYQVTGAISWFINTVVADKLYASAIFKNGVMIAISVSHASFTSFLSSMVHTILYLNANDYIELFGESQAGVDTVDIYGEVNGLNTYMSIAKIA